MTVRKWIGDVASDESEEAGSVWRNIFIPHFQPDKFRHPTMRRQEALGMLLDTLWLSYDIHKPFVPQLESNGEVVKKIFRLKEE